MITYNNADLGTLVEDTDIDPNKLTIWMETYANNLAKAVKKYPKQYPWYYVTDMDTLDLPASVLIVANRMLTAFIAGTYNKDGYAIKWTCKDLNIPYTYWGINAYLKGVL